MGWIDFPKAASMVYGQLFPWWNPARKTAALETPPLAKPMADGNSFNWPEYMRHDIWRRAGQEWTDLTGLPALHRIDGKGWFVAAKAAGVQLTFGDHAKLFDGGIGLEITTHVEAWAMVQRAKRVEHSPIPKFPDIVTIRKKQLWAALQIGDTEGRNRLKRHEIALAEPADETAKTIKVDLQQFNYGERERIRAQLKLPAGKIPH